MAYVTMPLTTNISQYPFEDMETVILHLSKVDETKGDSKLNRNANRNTITVSFSGNMLFLPPIEQQCAIDVIDINNGVTYFSQVLFPNVTQCELPENLKGTYKLRLTIGTSTYIGTLATKQ